MEVLVYLLVLVVVAIVVVGGIWASKKYNVKKKDLEFTTLLLELLRYISKSFEYKHDDRVDKVLEYSIIAIQIVQDNLDISDYDILKDIVFDKAKELCIDNGIEVDNELESILDKSIDYLIDTIGFRIE